MRKKKSAINMFVGVLVQMEIVLLGILNRRFFIHNLSIDYLGCNAVFVNILEILSLVCCGASAITYLMIKALASDDQEQVRRAFKINHVYQWVTCGALGVVGIILSPLLPALLENSTGFEWQFLQIVYFIFLVDVCITNWSGIAGSPGYYDCIIKVSQNSAVCSIFDCIVKNIYMIGQCIILIYYKNYIFYLCISVVTKVLYVFLTRWYCYKHFPYLKGKITVTREHIKESNIFAEIRNNIALVFAMVVFNGTDNIVITTFLGITIAGIYSNYQTIYNQLRGLLSKFINGMSMSVADYVHRTAEDDKKTALFYNVQFLCGVVGVVSTCCFFSLIQPFITLVFGDGLLLNIWQVIIISVLLFLNIFVTGSAMFRHSMGKYWLDRNFQLLSAAVNLILSIALASVMGLSGILVGTIAGTLVISQGYLKVIKIEAIRTFDKIKWWFETLLWTGAISATLCLLTILVENIDFTISGMAFRLSISIAMSMFLVTVICTISKNNRNCALFYVGQIKNIAKEFKGRMDE